MNSINCDEEIIISRKLGATLTIAGVSQQLLEAWSIMLAATIVAYIIVNMLVKVTPTVFVFLYVVALFTHWILLRKKPWQFVGKFVQIPDWTLGYPKFEYKNGQISKDLVGRKTISYWGSISRKVKAIEDELHLVSYVEYRLEQKKVGAYLLKKNGSYKLVFPFRIAGINDNQESDTVFEIISQLREGLRSLPSFETVTLVVRRMSSSKARLKVLKVLWKKCRSNPVKFLVRSLARRTRSLHQQKQHNPITAIVRFTYTLGDAKGVGADAIENILAMLEKTWLRYVGKKESVTKSRIDKNLRRGYYRGFVTARDNLKEQLGLVCSPIGSLELFQEDYFKLNSRTPPNVVPQLIVVDRDSAWFEPNLSTHITTYLHLHSLPVADRQWVYLPGIKKYLGGAVLIEKPGKLKKALPQLKIASKIINEIEDVEVAIELSAPDQKTILGATQWRVGESNANAKDSNARGKIDRKARHNLDEDIVVEDQFYSHEVAINVGFVAIPYRDNPTELDLAISKIEKLRFFSHPAEIAREKEYFPLIYLETLPLTWQKMLVKPFDRRKMYFSKEVPGLLPLGFCSSSDSNGFELIETSGYTPIYANLFARDFPQHMGIIGKTGSGKSVLKGGIAIEALAHNMYATIIDNTREDGTGSFQDSTNFLEGSYYNCLTEKINIVERPDTSKVSDPVKKNTVIQISAELTRQSLLALVVERDTKSEIRSRYRRLLDLSLSAFNDDPKIIERWKRAHEGGLGSEAWSKSPALPDFVRCLTPEYLERARTKKDPHGSNLSLTPQQKLDLAEIRLALETVIDTPLGQTISGPTTIDYSTPLVVIGIGGLKDKRDLQVLTFAAQSIAIKRTLLCDRSLIAFDEASYLVGTYDCMSEFLGELLSKARKLGATIVWGGQQLTAILNCANAADILENTTYYAIGQLAATAPATIAPALGIPKNILLKNTQKNFALPESEFASHWLFSDGERLAFCRYNPPHKALALLVNQRGREKKRQEFFAKHQDKYVALDRFTEHYVDSVKGRNAA